jgi:hypothetical protein
MHFHGIFPWKPHEYDQEQHNGKVSPVYWLAYLAGLEERHEMDLGKILDLL